MKTIHIPSLGTRYWTALCIASVFGANMGDFFARNLGLGHVAGLPFLAVALATVLVAERWDRLRHEVYYWSAIIIVRTAATNFADFTSVDLGLRRIWVIAALMTFLAGVVWSTWRFAWRRPGQTVEVLRVGLGYWICMFLAGALGTEIGDQCSHYLGTGTASVLLSPIVGGLFVIGGGGRLRYLPLYWITVVMIRTAGTSIGDFLASRHMLGLPLSTAVTGTAFVVLLLTLKELRSDEESGVELTNEEQTRA